MLAGHKRYAHIAALRGDGVLPELLDMSKIVSEDTVRRAFAAIEEEAGANWLRGHLDHCGERLLSEPWILDVDTTVTVGRKGWCAQARSSAEGQGLIRMKLAKRPCHSASKRAGA